MMNIEPYGIGSRNLAECISVQLKHMPGVPSYAMKVVQRHLNDIGSGRLRRIAEAERITLEQVQDAVACASPLTRIPV